MHMWLLLNTFNDIIHVIHKLALHTSYFQTHVQAWHPEIPSTQDLTIHHQLLLVQTPRTKTG